MSQSFDSGTFSGNTSSNVVKARPSDRVNKMAISVTLTDGGIDLERRVDGVNWRVGKSFTESTEENIEVVEGESWRLTRTDHTSTASYFIGYPRG